MAEEAEVGEEEHLAEEIVRVKALRKHLNETVFVGVCCSTDVESKVEGLLGDVPLLTLDSVVTCKRRSLIGSHGGDITLQMRHLSV